MDAPLIDSAGSKHDGSVARGPSRDLGSSPRLLSRGGSSSQDRPIVVYAARWTALALFCSLSLTVATMWVTFAPISDDTSIYFDDVGNSAVNILAAIFQIMYLPGTYVCVLVMQKYGMRANLLIAGVVTLLGALLRVVGTAARDQLGGTGAYAVVFMGQFLAALAQPMFVNVPAAFAGIWFPSDEREIATTITSLFNPLGNALGQILPPMFVTERDDGSVQGMRDLMVAEAVLIAVPLVVVYFFFQAAPPTPPSHAAQFKNKVAKEASAASDLRNEGGDDSNRVMNEFYELLKNRDYCILLLSFSIGLGLFNALLTLIFQIVSPYGYSNDDAGLLGAVLIGCGLLGAAVAGYLLKSTMKYREILKGGFLLAISATALFLSMLYSNNMTGLSVAFGLMGFFMLPMLPCVLENCAECTYPVSEESSSGLLFLGGNILGVCMVFGLQAFLTLEPFGPPPFTPNNLAMFLILLSAGVVLIFYNGQYKRLEMETSKERRVSKALDEAVVKARGDLGQVPAALLPSHHHGLLPTVAYSTQDEPSGRDEEDAHETVNLLHR